MAKKQTKGQSRDTNTTTLSSGGSNTNGSGKTLKEASSHKNIIQNTATAQAIIYGKLMKKQKKKNES